MKSLPPPFLFFLRTFFCCFYYIPLSFCFLSLYLFLLSLSLFLSLSLSLILFSALTPLLFNLPSAFILTHPGGTPIRGKRLKQPTTSILALPLFLSSSSPSSLFISLSLCLTNRVIFRDCVYHDKCSVAMIKLPPLYTDLISMCYFHGKLKSNRHSFCEL